MPRSKAKPSSSADGVVAEIEKKSGVGDAMAQAMARRRQDQPASAIEPREAGHAAPSRQGVTETPGPSEPRRSPLPSGGTRIDY